MRRKQNAHGFSLLEVILAIVIAATVAAIGISHLRKPATDSKQHACDLHREILQALADRYSNEQGQSPSRDLRELTSSPYYGQPLPLCPSTKRAYQLRRNVVGCPEHESTR